VGGVDRVEGAESPNPQSQTSDWFVGVLRDGVNLILNPKRHPTGIGVSQSQRQNTTSGGDSRTSSEID